MTKKCPECAVLNADNAASCSGCGKDLIEVKTDSNKTTAVDNPHEPWYRLLALLLTWNLRTNLIIWLAFVAFALLMGLLLMTWRV